MDWKLFLQEKFDFFWRIYGLKLEKNDALAAAMESSIEKNGFSLPFLVVPASLTHAVIKRVFREKIGIDYLFSEELDDLAKTTHERWPILSYFIRHGAHREATEGDEFLKLLSAEKIWEQQIVTMASLEVSQFAFESMLANGVLINKKSLSLASGSRCSDGTVPRFFCEDDGKIYVYRFHPSYSFDNLRARSAIV